MRKQKIQLQGCQNTRDLGGMVTKDGKRIKERKLIRSGALWNATSKDLECLTMQHDVRTIIDFRTLGEMEAKPDPHMKGVSYYKNPILERFEEEGEGKKQPSGNPLQEAVDRAAGFPDDAKGFMISVYPQLVRNEHCVNGYRKFFHHLLEQEEGAVLWHCSEGKDRVGVGTMLLLSALGVDMEEIKRDYLYTNHCIYDEVTMLLGTVSRLVSDRMVEEKIKYMLTVSPEYLQSVLDAIAEDYGTVDGFLREGLGLLKEDFKILREKYLEG